MRYPVKRGKSVGEVVSLYAFVRGRVRFESAEHVEIRISSKKGRALLAYLALNERGTVTRKELTDLLWSGAAGNERADRSLREELRKLRKALAAAGLGIGETQNKTLQLEPGNVWVDTAAELAALRTGAAPPRASTSGRGELLSDLIDETEEFGGWCFSQRNEYRDEKLQILGDRLAAAKAAPHDAGHILAATRVLFDAEPAAETVCVEFMRLLQASGRRAEVPEVFRRCEARLAKMHDGEPSAETRAVFTQICQPTIPDRSASAGPAAASPVLHAIDGADNQSRRPPPPTAISSSSAIQVGVFPVRNMTGDTTFDRLVANLTDDLMMDLIMLLGPVLVVDLSAGPTTEPGEAMADCQYVVVQSLQKGLAAGREVVRLNTKLLVSPYARGAAAYRIEHPVDTLPENHTAITNRIAEQIRLDLIKDVGARTNATPAEDLSPALLIMRGQSLMRRNTLSSVKTARSLFAASFARDPNAIDALVGIAHACHRMVSQPSFSDQPREDTKDGRAAANAALELDPNHVMANHVSGMLRSVEGDPDGAAVAFERIKARMHYAPAVGYGAYSQVFIDRPKRGLESIEPLIEKSAHDTSLPIYCFFAGVAEFHCGNYANAGGWFSKSLTYDASYGTARIWLAGSQALDGKKRQAEASLATFRASNPGYTLANFDATWGGARASNPQYLARTHRLAQALSALSLPQA
jgi:DNA-binding SARP family transcriptional activator